MWLFFRAIWTTLGDEYTAFRSIIGPLRLSKTELLCLFLRKTVHDANIRWRETPIGVQRAMLAFSALALMLSLDKLINSLSSLRRRGIPVLQRPKGVHRWDYRAILEEGKRKYLNTPYIIAYSGYEYIVYPSSSFEEIRRLPMARASLIEWATHVWFQGWRFLGTDNSTLHKMIAADLNRAVPESVRMRHEKASNAFDATVGPCPDWKSLRLYSAVQDIVTRTNAGTFMGSDLETNVWWLRAVQLLPMISMVAVFICHSTPRCFRPVVAFFTFFPAWSVYWGMEMLLRPIVKRDMLEYETALTARKVPDLLRRTSGKKLPITAWLMGRYPPKQRTPRQIGRDYINIAFESTAATSATIYFVISELTLRPELVRELREELAEHMVDDKLPLTSLSELQKLDSVMRESSRINAFSYLAVHRRVMQPVQLSIGPTLPPGALICVDAHHISMSSDLWKNPESFEPMRFFKLRQQPHQESQYQFTSLGPDSTGFGGGPQACPGRGYAGNLIKIILAHLLLNYDIQLDPRAVKPKRHSMPNASFVPDMFARILIREHRGVRK